MVSFFWNNTCTYMWARVALWIEYMTNEGVGSSPAAANALCPQARLFTSIASIAWFGIIHDCAYMWARVAQWIAYMTNDLKGVGSSPAAANALCSQARLFTSIASLYPDDKRELAWDYNGTLDALCVPALQDIYTCWYSGNTCKALWGLYCHKAL